MSLIYVFITFGNFLFFDFFHQHHFLLSLMKGDQNENRKDLVKWNEALENHYGNDEIHFASENLWESALTHG
jgi:hypothetical protein